MANLRIAGQALDWKVILRFTWFSGFRILGLRLGMFSGFRLGTHVVYEVYLLKGLGLKREVGKP